MAESEPLDANVKKAEAALKEEKQQVEAEKAQARERTAVDQKQLDELKAERQQLVAGLKKPTYSAYERIRKKWHGGSAVAEVTDGRCSVLPDPAAPAIFPGSAQQRRNDVLRKLRPHSATTIRRSASKCTSPRTPAR